MKRCSKCKEVKALTEFCQDRSTQDGRARSCRLCRQKYQREHQAEIKAYWQAHRDKTRHYREVHKEKRHAYRRAHAGEERAYSAWYHKTHRRERRAYQEAHKEEMRAYQRAYNVAHSKTERGKEKNRRSCNARRARKWGNTPPERMLTRGQWDKILAMSKGRCHWCGKKCKPTMDHVRPVSRGGQHTAENVVVSCMVCNLKKHAKIITLF